MSQSLAVTATSKGGPVSPEGTQEGNKYLPSSSSQIAATPDLRTLAPESWDTVEGMISVSPDLASSHTEKNAKFLNWDIWFSVIKNNLLFLLPALCCKTPMYPAPPWPPQSSLLRVTGDVTLRWLKLRGLSPQFCPLNKTQPSTFYLLTYLFICIFLGLHLQHMEFPRLGVKFEL